MLLFRRYFKGDDYDALEYVRETIDERTISCLRQEFGWSYVQAQRHLGQDGGVFALIWNDPDVLSMDQARIPLPLADFLHLRTSAESTPTIFRFSTAMPVASQGRR